MPPATRSSPDGETGRLAENVMHFARLLRAAGVPVGPGCVIDALRALELAGVQRRDDLYWTLAAVFLDRREQRELFDAAFRLFWRDPGQGPLCSPLPPVGGPLASARPADALPRRLVEALQRRGATPDADEPQQQRFDASLSVSGRESLRSMDFEGMSAAELAAARAAISAIRLRVPEMRLRRHAPHASGARIDARASLRASMRTAGAELTLKRRAPLRRPRPLVVLCDVSGSMSRYSRMFLHLVHAAVNGGSRVDVLTFGTRLTNITRHLRQRDPDLALAAVGRTVSDWSGGTRIGACLGEFNARWSRRLLGGGAVVILLSDGLDCEGGVELARATQRLRKSCHRLVWLNPLLRYRGFEPRPAGIRAMLPFVDEFLPAHNVDSLADLARAIAALPPGFPRRQPASGHARLVYPRAPM